MDAQDKAQEVADNASFTVAWGVDREMANALGAFWEENRNFIQPTEFIVSGSGRIISSTYSSSPVGRTDPGDALSLIKFISSRK